MSLVRMRALRTHGWMEGLVQRGEEYEATDQEAALLEALDWAERIGITLNGTARKTGRRTREVTANRARGYLTK